MQHLDIIGPPGSGKSTILEILTQNSCIKGNDDISELAFSTISVPTLNRSNILLPMVRENIGSLYWKYSLKYSYLEQFQEQYPIAFKLIQKVSELDSREHLLDMYKRAASETIFFREHFDQSFILDESLSQLGAEVLELNEDLGHSYLSVIPTPDTIIMVDCDAEICLNRQYNRKKPLASSIRTEEKQKAVERINRYQVQFETISNHLKKRGASVVSIESSEMGAERCAESILEQIE